MLHEIYLEIIFDTHNWVWNPQWPFFMGKTSLDDTEALQLLPRQHLYLQVSLTITTLSLITKKESNFRCSKNTSPQKWPRFGSNSGPMAFAPDTLPWCYSRSYSHNTYLSKIVWLGLYFRIVLSRYSSFMHISFICLCLSCCAVLIPYMVWRLQIRSIVIFFITAIDPRLANLIHSPGLFSLRKNDHLKESHPRMTLT